MEGSVLWPFSYTEPSPALKRRNGVVVQDSSSSLGLVYDARYTKMMISESSLLYAAMQRAMQSCLIQIDDRHVSFGC